MGEKKVKGAGERGGGGEGGIVKQTENVITAAERENIVGDKRK